MRYVMLQDHSDSPNAKSMNKTGWTQILQSLPRKPFAVVTKVRYYCLACS